MTGRLIPLREELERALDTDVRPGLSAHAGSIEVTDVDQGHVALAFLGSCRSCYFRLSCAVNLVAPTVRDVAGPVELTVSGVSSAQLRRLTA
jgi:Fe-S cluster biogenesis protein NfuA